MKITSVELHPQGSTFVCVLSFRDPSGLNPYNVKGITGLDPDDITSKFYGVPGTTAFYNMMSAKKTIAALVELNPDYSEGQTPSSLRDDLFRMISANRKGLIDILFKNEEEVVASISGSVQKLESSLFSDSPEAQITIKCKEPFLRAPEPVVLDVVGLDPELTVINDPLSTAPHGLKFELGITAVRDVLEISDPDDDDWAFTVTPLGGFLVDDVVHFSSEYNDKQLYVVRDDIPILLADAVMPGSIWPVIFPARDNQISISDGDAASWMSISYYPTYWGV